MRLLAVEDAKKIFSFDCSEPIAWLYWLQENDEMSERQEFFNFYEDNSKSQLPRPISYDIITQLFQKTNTTEFADHLLIQEAQSLTFLVCAYGTSIAIFAYGYFLLIDINLDNIPCYLNYKQLKSCFLSHNLSFISTLGLTEENLLVYSLLDTQILNQNHVQIKLVSRKFGLLFSMLTSMKGVIKEMEELWEDILVEMDQKFQLYALQKYQNGSKGNNASRRETGKENQPSDSSSLVNDFMLLYTFGSCSEQFKTFLMQELTEKGLKKLEQSVENYYSNIQRLINGNFQQISLCMFYHLNELYGMAKWTDKFKHFTITETKINGTYECSDSGKSSFFNVYLLFYLRSHEQVRRPDIERSRVELVRF
jgi:anaphase-promoting complex subunit 4